MKTLATWKMGALAVGLLAASLAHGATYHVVSVSTTDLGTLGGTEAVALDINNHGQIVGYSKNPAMRRRAFLWQSGVMTDLGTITASNSAHASGINDVGEVVGAYGDPDEFNWQAFYWSPGLGVVTLNRSLYPALSFNSAYVANAEAINSQGEIAGVVESRGASSVIPDLPCYRSLPVRWSTAFAPPQILHCPETHSGQANDINNLGWTVGTESATTFGPNRAFLWKAGVTTHLLAPFFGGIEPRANGINEAGTVVGSARSFAGGVRATIWDGASVLSTWIGVLLGGNSSAAYEVNDQNFVAGISDMTVNFGIGPPINKDRAFLWHRDFGLFALPVPAGMPALTTWCSAASLNNRVALTGLIEVVGRCGSRAIRWRVRVGIH